MPKVYTHYMDGQVALTGPDEAGPSDTWIVIPWWQWQAYRFYRWCDRRVSAWLHRLDQQAFDEWNRRQT